MCLCKIQSKQVLALLKDRRVRGVEVFRLGRPRHIAPGERHDLPRRIDDREHNPSPEVVVVPPALAPAAEEALAHFLLREAEALQVRQQYPELIGCVTQSEVPDNSGIQPARVAHVIHARLPYRGVEQAVAVETCRRAVQLIGTGAADAARLIAVLVRFRYLYTRPLGEKLHRLGVLQIFGAHHKGKGIPARFTAEAEKALRIGEHREGRRPFTVEGAKPRIVGAGTAQRDVRADKLHDVRPFPDAVYPFPWVFHSCSPLQTRGTNSSSYVSIAYRSVMPEMKSHTHRSTGSPSAARRRYSSGIRSGCVA